MWRPRFRAACLGATGALLAGDLAFADDALRMKSKAAAVPRYDWSGFYLGGHLGYSHGRADALGSDPNPATTSLGYGAMYGGLHAGYNAVLPSRVLLGVEADFSVPNFLDPDSVVAYRSTAGSTVITEHLDYAGRIRGRVGYVFDRWMLYGAGGFAWSQARFVESPGVGPDDDKVLRQRFGWTVGVGVEVAVAREWTARVEYLYDGFGHLNVTMPSGNPAASTTNLQTLRLGVSRKVGSWDNAWHNPWHNPWGSDGTPAQITPLSEREAGLWNLHGQFTLIGQGYPSFHSPYEGANSLSSFKQLRNTTSATAFIGVKAPWEGGEFYVNPELMQGFGLSDVHGIAAFPNGEAQKSSFPTPRINVARVFLRQTFGLGGEQEKIEDGPNQIAGKQDISRLTVTVGKLAVTDFFGQNTYANDPRTNFINWNMYGNGSYDWTMDKLSWTWGAVADLNQKHWAFRVGYFMVPTESNSNYFDTNIPSRGELAAELELRYALWSQPGKVRFFGWMNRAIMGSYNDAMALPLASPSYPDIALTRQVRTNWGGVVGIEQAINDDLGVFSRASWSPGQYELIGWTDVHNSLSLGTVFKGTSWGRPNDRIGLAGVTQGLSAAGRTYFAAGGLGVLIGDGALNYRRENVVEAYYAYSLNRFATLTLDYQFFDNPGYNADRGPVSVYTTRLHAEF